MLKKWPDATITLLVKRNKDEAYYVAVTELVDGILYWPVTRAETAVPGNGLIEIRATCGETIAKSITGFIRVSTALTGNETEPPETAKSWVDQVIEYGNEATQAAIKAKEEADRLSGINAKAVTLPAGSDATVTVEEDCLVYGIPRGDKGDPCTDATVTTESIKDALGYTPADDAAMAGKLTEPATGLAVGKYFRIAAIDGNGHAVLEAVDANVGGLSTEPSLWPAWTSDEQAAALKKIGGAFAGWRKIEKITIEEYVNNLIIRLNDYQDLHEIVIIVDANGTGAECKYKISVNSNYGYEFLHWNDASTIRAEPYTTYVHLSKIGNYWKSESINPKSPTVYTSTQSSKIIPYNKRQPEYNCVISAITLVEYDLGVGSAVYVMTR